MARRHFESGVAYLEESDYENALRAFQKAYDLSRRPEILLNVAVVQERRGDVSGALVALRQYVDEAKASDVETIKLRIQNLEKRQAAESPKPAPAAPPLAPVAPPPAPVVAPAPPAPRPSRTPVFVAFGVGAIATGGAVLTGIFANSEYEAARSDCSPSCSDSELSAGRALALTSTLLTGLAVVGVGVGITLLVLEKPEDRRSIGALSLGVAPALGGARANAAWRF